MKKEELFETAEYDPDALLDVLIDRLKLRSDAALARLLNVGPPVLSKIRHRQLKISSDLLVRMYDVGNLGLDYMRQIAGMPRTPGTKAPAAQPAPQAAEMQGA